jgi:uncharacterized pyridoxamine 5'-phosphate oxidase family protein
MYDGKIYVITSKHKEVSKQITENNNVCIVAYDDENWIRINCQLIDDSNNVAVKQAIINEFDWLSKQDILLIIQTFKFYIWQM